MAWACENTSGRRPHFFKVFFPCKSSKRLVIPRGFWKHIKHQTLGNVSLTGPSGSVWNIDLVRDSNGGMLFQNGWEEFVTDHSLGFGDFLVFRYDGDLNFTVLIFDPSSCEKEDTFHVRPCLEVTMEEACQMRCTEEGPVKDLIVADPEGNVTFTPENMCGKENPVVVCRAVPNRHNGSVECHSDEGPQVVNGNLITSEVGLGCRSSELDLMEPQVGPSLLLHDVEPEIVSIPGNLNKFCRCDWQHNSGFDSGHTPKRSLHKKPPSSIKHALCRQCCLDHSECMTCEEKEVPRRAPDTCRPEASMLKQHGMYEVELAEAPLPDKLHNSFVQNFGVKTQKCKKLAVKRSIHKKPTACHNICAVKQLCHDLSGCQGSSTIDSAKIKNRSVVESHRRPITEDERAKTLQRAQLFQSNNPFCLSVMRDSYVYRGFFMYLPNSLTQHLPKCSMKLKLFDSDNKPWGVVYRFFERGGALSGGWGKFTRAHNLETDDVCVFELLKPDEIRVHIFRVVEEITPLTWSYRRKKD